MSGSSDDVPARSRGAVPPPPSEAPDDAPSIHLPRMEPPPPSLEAMVTSTRASLRKPEPATTSWWVWLALALITAAVSAYVLR